MIFPLDSIQQQPTGLFLRATRILLGLKLSDLSEKTGFSVSYLSLLERGLRPFKPDVATRIAEVLIAPRTPGAP